MEPALNKDCDNFLSCLCETPLIMAENDVISYRLSIAGKWLIMYTCL